MCLKDTDAPTRNSKCTQRCADDATGRDGTDMTNAICLPAPYDAGVSNVQPHKPAYM